MLFLVSSPFVYPIGGRTLATIVRLDLFAINENCARLAIKFNMKRYKQKKPCQFHVKLAGLLQPKFSSKMKVVQCFCVGKIAFFV